MNDNGRFKEHLIDVSLKEESDLSISTTVTQAMIARQLRRSQSIKRAAIFSWITTAFFFLLWRLLNYFLSRYVDLELYLFSYDKTMTLIMKIIASRVICDIGLVISGLLTFYAYQQSRTLTLHQILNRLIVIENTMKIKASPNVSGD